MRHSTVFVGAHVGVLIQLSLDGGGVGGTVVGEIDFDSKSREKFQSDVPDWSAGAGVIIHVNFVVFNELWGTCELHVVVHC